MSKGYSVEILGDISLSYCNLTGEELRALTGRMNNSFSCVDFRIANLESPFADEDDIASDKIGPNLSVRKDYCEFFKQISVDAYTLANNHLGDFGESGVRKTIQVLEEIKKLHVGAGESIYKAYEPLRINREDVKLSFISVCENEFGVAGDNRAGTAGYDDSRIKESIKQEKKNAYRVIVLYHGGNEYFPFPSPGLIDRFHFMADNGADVVIGTHSHCLKGMEKYENSWLIYGIGNFFFPTNNESVFDYWGTGMGVRLLFGKEIVLSRKYYKFDKTGHLFETILGDGLEEYYNRLSETIKNRRKIDTLFSAWSYMSGKNMFSQAYGTAFSDSKTQLWWKNLFCCEAHNEVMKRYLEMTISGEVPNLSDIRYIKDNMTTNTNTEESSDNICRAEIVIWGCGSRAERAVTEYESKKIVIVDNDQIKQGLYFMGYLVISPDKVVESNKIARYIICTGVNSYYDIERILKECGICKIEYFK